MRLTKFNPETGQYEYIEKAKTQEEFIAQRKAVIQRLGELEDKIEQGDVVEVVRCRDCKHFTKGMAIGMCKRVEEKPIIPCRFDNYCMFGERSEE